MKKLLVVAVVVVGVIIVLGRFNEKPDQFTSQSVPYPPSSTASTPDVPVTTGEADSPAVSGWGEGHEAGYNWAEEHDIDDESDCDTAGDTSNSPSFSEGCRAYVQENEPANDSGNDDPDN